MARYPGKSSICPAHGPSPAPQRPQPGAPKPGSEGPARHLPSPGPQPSTPAAPARCPQTQLRRSSPAPARVHPRFLTFASSARYLKVFVLYREMWFTPVPGKCSICPGSQPRRDQRGPRRAQGAGPAPPRAQPSILAIFANPGPYPGPVPQGRPSTPAGPARHFGDFCRPRPGTPARYHRVNQQTPSVF